MKSLKKMLFSIFIVFIIYITLIKNFVYADLVLSSEIITYSPLYYIAIFLVLAIVIGLSIFILRIIYKKNQSEEKENVEGDEK